MLKNKMGLIALLTSVAVGGVRAGTITNYATGDVLICFRAGGQNMVVDAGPISTFTGASHNQRIPITQYTGTQLAAVGTNGVSWSAFTWLGDNTLFITKARTSLNQQTTPWQAASSPVQSGTIGAIKNIPPGALDYFNLLVYPVSTATAVVEDGDSYNPPYSANYTDGISYQDALTGSYGSAFDGKFQGNPENTTLSTFTKSGTVVRSDFYQLTPTSSLNAPGIWLGYFEFNTNGAMTYVAYPTTTPVVSSISVSGTTATITYKSGLYGTYNLLGTNNLSAPVSTWPVIGGNLATGTATFTVQDTGAVSNRFYMIEGQ